MSLYLDASALMKRYVDEPDSERAASLIRTDPLLMTAWLSVVEVRRNLARLLEGPALAAARSAFAADLERLALLDLDAETCERAATIAEMTGLRTLAALHLGAAQRAGATLLTFDARQAQAARGLGIAVLGS